MKCLFCGTTMVETRTINKLKDGTKGLKASKQHIEKVKASQSPK